MANWIASMHMKKGALHRDLGVPQGQKIGASRIAAAASSDNPQVARRARLAQTFARMRRG